jgi:hypothetical protein
MTGLRRRDREGLLPLFSVLCTYSKILYSINEAKVIRSSSFSSFRNEEDKCQKHYLGYYI